MPPSVPYSPDLLSQHWPLLVQCCSPVGHSAGIAHGLTQVRDPEALLQMAREHGVVTQLSAILTRSTLAQLNGPFFALIHSARKAQLMHAMSLTAELFRITEAFGQQRLSFLATKGPTLAYRAYGDSTSRRYVDLDLLVRHSDIPRAAQLVSELGYNSALSLHAIADGAIPGEYFFQRSDSGFLLELHTERSFRYFPRPLPIESFLQRSTLLRIDGRPVPALSLEDEFVLISVHGAKHFWERLMWIADVAAIVHGHPELDWRRVRESAASVGAERMVRVALLLAERLLLVPVPEPMKKGIESDAACAKIVRKIESWLPYAGNEPPSLIQRALFRFRMRGQLLAGAHYLTRLSLSTTEEDWSVDSQSVSGSLRESLRRPFRLAKKYRRNPDAPER